MVVPVGENGSWFISSKSFVHEEKVRENIHARKNDEANQVDLMMPLLFIFIFLIVINSFFLSTEI